ncbi:hypothetical protein [Ascidiimonas aurantiaca]|uniref:hypothetical protein n=1 Tax=Ascidiimonas aurantiaca TaxID=1685432 RepID=UPI0030ED0A1C
MKITLLAICICLVSFAQEKEEEIDFLTYSYKYLDRDHQITIDSLTFQEGVKKYKFIPDRIRTYKDSLSVIAMLNFGDWKKERKVVGRITYSWEALSYHLWMNEKETESFARSLGITHPWRMFEFLSLESNTNTEVNTFFTQLKQKVTKHTGKEIPTTVTRKKFLNYAFRVNPVRIEKAKQYFKEKGLEGHSHE